MLNNIINLKLDQKIYRVFPHTRALDLFTENKNALVRPSMWDDPFENFFLNARVFDKATGQEISIKNLQSRWYGQCWTSTSESDAMWRIYSPNKDSVCVQTTVGKLFQSFYNKSDEFASLKFFIGKVQYEPGENIAKFVDTNSFADAAIGGDNKGFVKTLLLKRNEFKHEDEVRLLFYDEADEFFANNVVPFEFDAPAIIESLMFDPRLDHRVFHSLCMAFQSAGGTCNMERSKLYDAQQLVINLG